MVYYLNYFHLYYFFLDTGDWVLPFLSTQNPIPKRQTTLPSRPFQKKGGAGRKSLYLFFFSILIGVDLDSLVLGMVIFKTPSSATALALLPSTEVGRGMFL